jgi:transcriptional regulator with XRE-family HTH domain
VTFGKLLRQLRDESGTGIKRLAPELGVSYTYLSKIENDVTVPSEELVARMAKYFGYDQDRMLLAAGKVPEEILQILRDNPDEAVRFLRQRFGAKHESPGPT